MTTATGYGSSSDRTVFFGTGKDAVVKSIEIIWPSGVRQRLDNVKGDQYLTIEEREDRIGGLLPPSCAQAHFPLALRRSAQPQISTAKQQVAVGIAGLQRDGLFQVRGRFAELSQVQQHATQLLAGARGGRVLRSLLQRAKGFVGAALAEEKGAVVDARSPRPRAAFGRPVGSP